MLGCVFDGADARAERGMTSFPASLNSVSGESEAARCSSAANPQCLAVDGCRCKHGIPIPFALQASASTAVASLAKTEASG